MTIFTTPQAPSLGQLFGQGVSSGLQQQLPQMLQQFENQRQSQGMADVMGQITPEMPMELMLQKVYQQQGLNPSSQSQLVNLMAQMPMQKYMTTLRKQQQEKLFRDYSLEQLKDKTPEEQQRFLGVSKQFKDVIDPAERYRKAEEAHREREKIRGTLETVEKRPNWLRTLFGAEARNIKQSHVIARRALENKIPVEEVEAQFAAKGHSPIEVEAIVHPLPKSTEMKVKQLGKELKKFVGGTGVFTSKDTETKLALGLRNLIKEDTSLLLVSDMLKKQGITEKTVAKALRELAASGVRFTDKQTRDFAKIGQGVEGKAQSLSEIFGGE